MCGITGFVSRSAPDREALKAMADRIRHRGPDDEGYYVDDTCAIAHRRLSIIDLAHGHQPMTSPDGNFVLAYNGEVYNFQELREELIARGCSFSTNSDTEVILQGYAQEGPAFTKKLRGMFAFVVWDRAKRELYAARDRLGRLPVLIGKGPEGHCVSFESFAYHKLGYEDAYELGPREIVRVTADGFETLVPAGDEMKICAFLWTYYGYPNSNYEGVNVEVMRYRNGEIMARDEEARGVQPDVDFVAGVPDSGVPHAIGYANKSGKQFARPFVKYTPTWPRSFMPANQEVRNQVAKMKQIPVPELIQDKKLLFVDDSIVRGTQLRETVDFLYESGAKEVHMRSACPPIMYSCKYLNFSRGNSDMDLLARRTIQELEGDEGQKHLEEYADANTERGQCMLKSICEKMGFDSLGYQSLDGLLESIGLDRDKVCTYCWNGKE